MKCFWYEKREIYDGSQLKPLHNYLKHGVLGDSVVSWSGPCELSPEHIIDGEDLRAGSVIRAVSMLHFILELFNYPLSGAVAFQRLMGELLVDQIALTVGEIKQMARTKGKSPVDQGGGEAGRGVPDFFLKRKGDDLYRGREKLNISVATCSAQSSLIHFGVNITNEGTPVPTCSLRDFGITDEKGFALDFMATLKGEFGGMKDSWMKVRSF